MEKSSVVESIIEITDDTKQLKNKMLELEDRIQLEIKELNTKINLLGLVIIVAIIATVVH